MLQLQANLQHVFEAILLLETSVLSGNCHCMPLGGDPIHLVQPSTENSNMLQKMHGSLHSLDRILRHLLQKNRSYKLHEENGWAVLKNATFFLIFADAYWYLIFVAQAIHVRDFLPCLLFYSILYILLCFIHISSWALQLLWNPNTQNLPRTREEIPLTSRVIAWFPLSELANMAYGTLAYFLNLGFFVMLWFFSFLSQWLKRQMVTSYYKDTAGCSLVRCF